MKILLEQSKPQKSKKGQLRESIISEIEAGKTLQEGARLPSTGELARQWNVAHATAHAVLNELMRDGWLIRTPRGTFVAPRRKFPAIAAVPLPPREDITKAGSGDEIAETLQGLVDGAFEENWQLQIERVPSLLTAEDQEKVFQKLCQVPFVVFLGTSYRSLVERLHERNVRSIFLFEDPGAGDVITYDRTQAVRLAIDHFVATGRRRIGYFGNAHEVQSHGKFQSYLRLLKERGLEVDERWIGHCKSHATCRQQVQEFLDRRPTCDALFVANYRFASILIEEVRYRQLEIPKQISIIANGVEGDHQPHLALSYVKVPYQEFGKRAIQHMIYQQTVPTFSVGARSVIILNPTLVLRETTLTTPHE